MLKFCLNSILAILILSLSIACTNAISSEKTEYIYDANPPLIFAFNIGENIDDVKQIVTSSKTEIISLEGVETTILHAKIGHDVDADIFFDEDNKVYSITTKSPTIKDEYGLGVGSTLEELKHNYPLNYLGIGIEHGRGATFITPGYLIFELEPVAFPEGCFLSHKTKCVFDDELVTVSELRIINIDMTEHVKSLN